MKKVKIFQIGLGSFGRHGFEKLLEISNHLPEADAELVGVCDSDLERLRSAEKFAETHETDIETFRKEEEMYDRAEKRKNEDCEVLIYDAGPTESHPEHIYESLERGLYHLSEKPSSMKREEHLKEKRLADDRKVIWKVDFIERENPAVKKTLEILKEEKPEIEKIEVFRESSIGVEKILDPINRIGVKGGDILDKMIHEVYVVDFIEAVGGEIELELDKAETELFMPKEFDTQKLMSIDGGYTREINEKTATGMTHAKFNSGNTQIELNSSWLGMSDKSQERARQIKEKTGREIFRREFIEEDDRAFIDEEARFFVIHGDRYLAGDMLHGRLYDLETGEEIKTRDLIHDQLYRVLERSVMEASGLAENSVSEKELDVFMNSIFDVRESAVKNSDFRSELESGKEKLESLIVEDGKILENEESERIAG